MPPTSRQREFFKELLNTRQFPENADKNGLLARFDGLSQDSASKWVDSALKLPKVDSSEGDNTPPPF